jgi:hypothetical protein
MSTVEAELKAMRDQAAKAQRDLEYRLDTMSMKRAWQESDSDNVDATHPLRLDLYIPPLTKHIERARLRFRLQNFRSYGTGAASGGGSTSGASSITTTDSGGGSTSGASSITTTDSGGGTTPTSGGGTWYTESGYTSGLSATDLFGDHDHGGAVATDGAHTHVITLNHSHTVTIAAHSHGMEHTHTVPAHSHGMEHTHSVPAHTHGIVHGIYEGTAASAVTVAINGTDRTVALNGPFAADADDLDITEYLTTTGWNTISLGSGTLGRIHATVFVEIYLP